MTAEPDGSPIAVLLSGGLDSAILLGHLVALGHRVQPIYLRGNLRWEPAELAAARAFVRAMARPALEDLVVLDMPLSDLYGVHWSTDGAAVPDASTPDEAVYLPGRNPLLLLKPIVWCGLHGIGRLALGVLGSNPFHDATPEFFDPFAAAMEIATGRRVEILRPLADRTKREVMLLGRKLPLERTFSCIAPQAGRHCGGCNKCAERAAAFRLAGLNDPTWYAQPPGDGRRLDSTASA
jgi:7-cyano-7-deazaguanine synthase